MVESIMDAPKTPILERRDSVNQRRIYLEDLSLKIGEIENYQTLPNLRILELLQDGPGEKGNYCIGDVIAVRKLDRLKR